MTASLLAGQVLPSSRLPAAGGGEVRLTAYRGRASLAVYLFPGGDSPPARACLAAVAAHLSGYEARHTQPLAILGTPLAVAETVRAALGLPFPLAADEAGRVLARLTGDQSDGEPVPAVLLADRYAEVRVHLTGWAALQADQQPELLDWLTYIDCLCSC
jgi:peroxiredoxin